MCLTLQTFTFWDTFVDSLLWGVFCCFFAGNGRFPSSIFDETLRLNGCFFFLVFKLAFDATFDRTQGRANVLGAPGK